MGRSGETNPSRGFWKLVFSAVALLCTLPLVAQKAQEPSPPKYDVHTETKMKGTVDEVKLPPKGSEKEVAHLLVKTGADIVDVYLCPKSFLDDMGDSFKSPERRFPATGCTLPGYCVNPRRLRRWRSETG
ncbi:MAG TPA: hypothetical protein VE957_05205 [Terriglobales bacterium]|nr:hypothetical protein [Terriglobales bacterium]